MNPNDQEIGNGHNKELWNIQNIKKFSIHFFISNQISRILLRPINRAEVIVKAASRKPK